MLPYHRYTSAAAGLPVIPGKGVGLDALVLPCYTGMDGRQDPRLPPAMHHLFASTLTQTLLSDVFATDTSAFPDRARRLVHAWRTQLPCIHDRFLIEYPFTPLFTPSAIWYGEAVHALSRYWPWHMGRRSGWLSSRRPPPLAGGSGGGIEPVGSPPPSFSPPYGSLPHRNTRHPPLLTTSVSSFSPSSTMHGMDGARVDVPSLPSSSWNSPSLGAAAAAPFRPEDEEAHEESGSTQPRQSYTIHVSYMRLQPSLMGLEYVGKTFFPHALPPLLDEASAGEQGLEGSGLRSRRPPRRRRAGGPVARRWPLFAHLSLQARSHHRHHRRPRPPPGPSGVSLSSPFKRRGNGPPHDEDMHDRVPKAAQEKGLGSPLRASKAVLSPPFSRRQCTRPPLLSEPLFSSPVVPAMQEPLSNLHQSWTGWLQQQSQGSPLFSFLVPPQHGVAEEVDGLGASTTALRQWGFIPPSPSAAVAVPKEKKKGKKTYSKKKKNPHLHLTSKKKKKNVDEAKKKKKKTSQKEKREETSISHDEVDARASPEASPLPPRRTRGGGGASPRKPHSTKPGTFLSSFSHAAKRPHQAWEPPLWKAEEEEEEEDEEEEDPCSSEAMRSCIVAYARQLRYLATLVLSASRAVRQPSADPSAPFPSQGSRGNSRWRRVPPLVSFTVEELLQANLLDHYEKYRLLRFNLLSNLKYRTFYEEQLRWIPLSDLGPPPVSSSSMASLGVGPTSVAGSPRPRSWAHSPTVPRLENTQRRGGGEEEKKKKEASWWNSLDGRALVARLRALHEEACQQERALIFHMMVAWCAILLGQTSSGSPNARTTTKGSHPLSMAIPSATSPFSLGSSSQYWSPSSLREAERGGVPYSEDPLQGFLVHHPDTQCIDNENDIDEEEAAAPVEPLELPPLTARPSWQRPGTSSPYEVMTHSGTSLPSYASYAHPSSHPVPRTSQSTEDDGRDARGDSRGPLSSHAWSRTLVEPPPFPTRRNRWKTLPTTMEEVEKGAGGVGYSSFPASHRHREWEDDHHHHPAAAAGEGEIRRRGGGALPASSTLLGIPPAVVTTVTETPFLTDGTPPPSSTSSFWSPPERSVQGSGEEEDGGGGGIGAGRSRASSAPPITGTPPVREPKRRWWWSGAGGGEEGRGGGGRRRGSVGFEEEALPLVERGGDGSDGGGRIRSSHAPPSLFSSEDALWRSYAARTHNETPRKGGGEGEGEDGDRTPPITAADGTSDVVVVVVKDHEVHSPTLLPSTRRRQSVGEDAEEGRRGVRVGPLPRAHDTFPTSLPTSWKRSGRVNEGEPLAVVTEEGGDIRYVVPPHSIQAESAASSILHSGVCRPEGGSPTTPSMPTSSSSGYASPAGAVAPSPHASGSFSSAAGRFRFSLRLRGEGMPQPYSTFSAEGTQRRRRRSGEEEENDFSHDPFPLEASVDRGGTAASLSLPSSSSTLFVPIPPLYASPPFSMATPPPVPRGRGGGGSPFHPLFTTTTSSPPRSSAAEGGRWGVGHGIPYYIGTDPLWYEPVVEGLDTIAVVAKGGSKRSSRQQTATHLPPHQKQHASWVDPNTPATPPLESSSMWRSTDRAGKVKRIEDGEKNEENGVPSPLSFSWSSSSVGAAGGSGSLPGPRVSPFSPRPSHVVHRPASSTSSVMWFRVLLFARFALSSVNARLPFGEASDTSFSIFANGGGRGGSIPQFIGATRARPLTESKMVFFNETFEIRCHSILQEVLLHVIPVRATALSFSEGWCGSCSSSSTMCSSGSCLGHPKEYLFPPTVASTLHLYPSHQQSFLLLPMGPPTSFTLFDTRYRPYSSGGGEEEEEEEKRYGKREKGGGDGGLSSVPMTLRYPPLSGYVAATTTWTGTLGWSLEDMERYFLTAPYADPLDPQNRPLMETLKWYYEKEKRRAAALESQRRRWKKLIDRSESRWASFAGPSSLAHPGTTSAGRLRLSRPPTPRHPWRASQSLAAPTTTSPTSSGATNRMSRNAPVRPSLPPSILSPAVTAMPTTTTTTSSSFFSSLGVRRPGRWASPTLLPAASPTLPSPPLAPMARWPHPPRIGPAAPPRIRAPSLAAMHSGRAGRAYTLLPLAASSIPRGMELGAGATPSFPSGSVGRLGLPPLSTAVPVPGVGSSFRGGNAGVAGNSSEALHRPPEESAGTTLLPLSTGTNGNGAGDPLDWIAKWRRLRQGPYAGSPEVVQAFYEYHRFQLLAKRWEIACERAKPDSLLEARILYFPIPLREEEHFRRWRAIQKEIRRMDKQFSHTVLPVEEKFDVNRYFSDPAAISGLAYAPIPKAQKAALWKERLRRLALTHFSASAAREVSDEKLLARYVTIPKFSKTQISLLKPRSGLNPRRVERPKTEEIDRQALKKRMATAMPKRRQWSDRVPYVKDRRWKRSEEEKEEEEEDTTPSTPPLLPSTHTATPPFSTVASAIRAVLNGDVPTDATTSPSPAAGRSSLAYLQTLGSMIFPPSSSSHEAPTGTSTAPFTAAGTAAAAGGGASSPPLPRPIQMTSSSYITMHLMKISNLPARDDGTPLEPFVVISFVHETACSRSNVGTSPSWFESLHLPFDPYNFEEETLRLIDDDIVITVYDKREIPMPVHPTPMYGQKESHYRTERRFLCSLRVPFSALHQADEARLESVFPLNVPRWVLGYQHGTELPMDEARRRLTMSWRQFRAGGGGGGETRPIFPSLPLKDASAPPDSTGLAPLSEKGKGADGKGRGLSSSWPPACPAGATSEATQLKSYLFPPRSSSVAAPPTPRGEAPGAAEATASALPRPSFSLISTTTPPLGPHLLRPSAQDPGYLQRRRRTLHLQEMEAEEETIRMTLAVPPRWSTARLSNTMSGTFSSMGSGEEEAPSTSLVTSWKPPEPPTIQLYLSLWPPLQRPLQQKRTLRELKQDILPTLYVGPVLARLHLSALQWKKEGERRIGSLVKLNHRAKKRYLNPFVRCSTGDFFLICRYLLPEGCAPPAASVRHVYEAIRFTSLLPYVVNATEIGEVSGEEWSTNGEMISWRSRRYVELSILLWHFMRYLAPQEEVYIVQGEGHLYREVMLVLHRLGTSVHWHLIDPITGGITRVEFPHGAPIRDVHAVFSPFQIWANIQVSGLPHRMSWDLEDRRHWFPCFTPAESGELALHLAPIQRRVLHFAPVDKTKAKVIEVALEEALRKALRVWRPHHPPCYRRALSELFRNALMRAEEERCCSGAWDAALTRALEVEVWKYVGEAAVPGKASSSAEPLAGEGSGSLPQGAPSLSSVDGPSPASVTAHEISPEGRVISHRYGYTGVPVTATYNPGDTHFHHILDQVYQSAVHEVGTDDADFALGVYVKSYGGEVFAMNVFLVAIFIQKGLF